MRSQKNIGFINQEIKNELENINYMVVELLLLRSLTLI